MTHHDPINPRGLFHADNEADFDGESHLHTCPCCGLTYGEHQPSCPNFYNLHDIDDDALEALCATVDVDAINPEVTT